MRFKPWLLLLYTIVEVKSNESCSRINLSEFSGEYVSQFQHNGNQEYFRSDGKFNLFSFQEGNVCQWRISNIEEMFPFSKLDQNNCETLFVDSKFVWETFNSENEIQPNEILINCILSSGDDFKTLKISIFVIIIIASIILLILMHVNIRKRRILRATNDCKICKQREENIKILNITNTV